MRNCLALLFLFLVSSIGCTKIENLSDDTSLKSFVVVGHSPQSIELGDVRIVKDSVYIPIEYGKYNFPLTLEVETTVSSGAYTYGIAQRDVITFDSIDAAPIRFVVSAENGASKNYFIAPLEIPLGESTELLDEVSFVNSYKLLSGTLIAGETKNERLIVSINNSYPLSLIPRFSVDKESTIESFRKVGSSSWESYTNGGEELCFDNPDEHYEFTIKSQSGKSAVWRVSILNLEYSEITSTMQVNYRDLMGELAQEGVEISHFDIDFKRGEIAIVIEEAESAQVQFPLEVSLDIPVSDWLTVVGAAEKYTFESWDDSFDFALLDSKKRLATHWSVVIKKLEVAAPEVAIESSSVESFSCGSSFFIFSHFTRSKSKPEPEVYSHSKEVVLYYSSYYTPSVDISSWWCEYTLNITLDNGETMTQKLRWDAPKKDNGKISANEIHAVVATPKFIDVAQPDGTITQWSVNLVKDNIAVSDACQLLGCEIEKTIPSYIDLKEPACTIDDSAAVVYINIGDRYSFPMMLDMRLDVSPYASVSAESFTFESESSEPVVTVLAQDGATSKDYTLKLIVPQDAAAPDLIAISFDQPSNGAMLVGEPLIDAENYTVTIGVEANDAQFPLNIPIMSSEVADGGHCDIPQSGVLTFSSAKSSVMLWVISEDGTARQPWNLNIRYYQQVVGSDMNSWEWKANPITSSLPWSTPNMSGLAAVTNTTPIDGKSGAEGDHAAELKTGTSWGYLAAGSIFTGWFDKDNSMSYGTSDPVRLTHFGIPFAPDAKIKGVLADVSYAQAEGKVDWGSFTVILIAEDSSKKFEFHGNKPNSKSDPTQGSAPHPNNSAKEVAISKLILGNGAETKTTYGDVIDKNLAAGEWTEIFVPISTDKPFTHISIAAASSAYGDYFIGEEGSVMRVDNVRIIYE